MLGSPYPASSVEGADKEGREAERWRWRRGLDREQEKRDESHGFEMQGAHRPLVIMARWKEWG